MANLVRLRKELDLLAAAETTEGFRLVEEDVVGRGIIIASFRGPSDSPYEDGIFRLQFKYPRDYPFKPPSVRYLTPVFHPHISTDGTIDCEMLGDAWLPGYTLLPMLRVLQVHLSQTAVGARHGSSILPDDGQLAMPHYGLQPATGDGQKFYCLNGEAGTAWLTNAAAAEARARDLVAINNATIDLDISVQRT